MILVLYQYNNGKIKQGFAFYCITEPAPHPDKVTYLVIIIVTSSYILAMLSTYHKGAVSLDNASGCLLVVRSQDTTIHKVCTHDHEVTATIYKIKVIYT